MLHLAGDMRKLQTKLRQMEKAITVMEEEAFEWRRLAEEKSELSYVIKGNGLKHKSEESKIVTVVLAKGIEVL